ncbi:MAG TPA: glucose-1-phosphate adenylyltransferase subunit GlgD [Erysipelotrichaceae bacterium]|nr:glucose-1-phosphate adenylyltransferase subunit GlgD [Erysipelotrichaceae bacterium]
MIKNCFGIISVRSHSEDYGALCKPREEYMLPFGGRYRLVDFMLSNMVNHGIDTVAVYTGEKMRSTMDHIGDGKPWELSRRISGLHIFPHQRTNGGSDGDIAQFHFTDDFLQTVKEENIFVISSNQLVKFDLTAAYNKFIESGSDVTLLYSKMKNDPIHYNSDNIVFGENGEFENLGTNLGSAEEFNLYLGAAFIKKSVFREIIRETMETADENNIRTALLKRKDELKITAFEHTGHVENIKDYKSYYLASMNLLDAKISQETFFDGGAVFTRAKDEPPTLYTDDSKVENSLIANGCVIEGTVTNSIIFRGVKIKKGTVIKDSIIMQKSVIEEDAYIVKSILDKHTYIDAGVTLVGTKSNPYIVEKGTRIRKAD